LIIEGANITDISGIQNIHNIEGHLLIKETSLTDISSLNSLEAVNGRLFIEDNPFLEEINLSNIEEIGRLNIENNQKLSSISGFDKLACTSQMEFSYNEQLQSINGFNAISSAGVFQIIENPDLQRVEGFSNLAEISSVLYIHQNPELLVIPAFNDLQKIEGLRISYNQKLTTFGEYQNLKKANYIHIEYSGNSNTTPYFSSFDNLIEINSISLRYLGIEKIDAFKNVYNLGDLTLEGMANLTDFNALNKVDHILFATIRENAGLISFSSLQNLKEVAFSILLYQNTSLETIDGLSKLEKVGYELQISSMDKLKNLDFLNKLRSVTNSLSIQFNMSLTDCSGLSNYLNYGKQPIFLTIRDNPFPCNTAAEIAARGDNDGDGIADAVDLDDDNDGLTDLSEQDGDPTRDSDLDLLPDHLDPDSDNDGCFDVFEAGFSDPDVDGILGSGKPNVDSDGKVLNEPSGYNKPADVNLNAVPDYQEYWRTPLYNLQPQSVEIVLGQSATFTTEVVNASVLQWEKSTDAGNNWIPLIEGADYSGVNTQELMVTNPSIAEDLSLYRLRISNPASNCYTPRSSNIATLSIQLPLNVTAGNDTSVTICENEEPVDLFSLLPGNPIQGGTWYPLLQGKQGYFDPVLDEAVTYTYTVTDANCNIAEANVAVNLSTYKSAGENGDLTTCTSNTPVDLFESLNGNPITGGIWTPTLSSGTGIFDPAVDPEGIYTYTIINNGCENTSATVEVTLLEGNPNAGDDGEITTCIEGEPVDLFQILGNNPDAEGMWSPQLISETGVFDPVIDAPGIYTYTIDRGACGIDEATVNVIVEQLPNAGISRTFTVCEEEGVIDLFTQLDGIPQEGGVWSPVLASGSGIFDPALDVSGVYVYTVNNSCGSASAEIDITVIPIANAGEDAAISVCKNEEAQDLFFALSGTPDDGGLWSPQLYSGTGIFDPAIDEAGIYTYTVINGNCTPVSAQITVSVEDISAAGEDGILEICNTGAAVDLMNYLNGNPVSGGTWSPALNSGGSIFDPSRDTAASYFYTVNDGLCGESSARVDIIRSAGTPITNFEVNAGQRSGSNFIEIIINTPGDFEYSLDDFYYQEGNIFNDIAGGNYTVYAREKGGCGILRQRVSIFSFPRYFTPNNDGRHDNWQPLGTSDQNFTVFIYDRYGKLLKQINQIYDSWDGTYNGRQLPADDYWFHVEFADGSSQKGHFSLIR
tara:strand:- start:173411 stop:177037 length:3627 start_codon:yes stop_codon:yes gene_type:complete